MSRATSVSVTEFDSMTTVDIACNEDVKCTFSFAPKCFADPRVENLESVIASQRQEIEKARTETAIAKAAYEARKTVRRRK